MVYDAFGFGLDDILGISWRISGCHLNDICNPFGRHLANKLEVIWVFVLDDIWRSFGRHLGIIWKAYAADVDDSWGSFVVIHFLQDETKEG